MPILKFETKVKTPLSEIFPFFGNPLNLEKITPPWLHFKILDSSTSDIQKGTLINYSLRIKGFPAKWRTLISEWNPPYSFEDTQLKGPYKKWVHTHRFTETSEGILMEDIIDYEIPFGFLGELLMGKLIRKDVETIFSYREKVIKDLFK